jgi:hypothetical protein
MTEGNKGMDRDDIPKLLFVIFGEGNIYPVTPEKFWLV